MARLAGVRLAWPVCVALAGALQAGRAAQAQAVMGSVSTHDAQVNGGLEVHDERAALLSNAGVTALDHTAPVRLSRGGEVLVCSTSQFHLLHAGAGPALLFGLDRGAVELHGAADKHDVLLTPDIRFAIEAAGTYDLSLRVTSNGDTCVDNAGADAPVLVLTDPFSSASYRLIPGQHVLFEHGSLKEVVDNERSRCGCPETLVPRTAAEAAHPFPAAASAGLAPVSPPGNSTPDGSTHAQVNETLTYTSGQPPPPVVAPEARPATNPASNAAAAPPPTPPGGKDILHAIGHFFHKLFHPGAQQPQS